MTRRRVLRALALVCLVGGVAIGVTPTPSSAESPQATGWWSRRAPSTGEVEGQSARAAVRFTPAATPGQELPTDPTIPEGPITTLPTPVPVPTVPVPPIPLPEDPGPGTPNPTVPDGGLWVANDPTGAVAISALRYRGDIGAGELTLEYAPGSTTDGPLVACPALSEFEPGPGGAWRDRPAHDCDRMAMSGRLSSDGTAVEFTIPQGFLPFGERVLDIVILPDPDSGDPFSATFQKPDETSLDVTQGQDLPPSLPEPPEIDPLTLPTTLPEFDDSGTDSFVDIPVDEDEEVAAGPSDDSTGGGLTAPDPISQILEPLTESRFGRIVSVAVLLAMGAGLWLFGGQPVRHPRLLGALAGDAAVVTDQPATGRGIGRFQRDRTTPPHRL